MNTIKDYLKNISNRFSLGNATEHTYRGDLQQLLESMVTGIAATNEPQRISCGAPDYILTRKGIPAGYIEAKNIGENLNDKLFKEQFDRYKASLDNLIITDYIDFQFYIDGGYKTAVRIAEIRNGKLIALPDNFANFETLIIDFCAYQGQTIKSSRKLAEMMAAKARMLADVIEKALDSDEENEENSSLKDQFLAFRQILIHDINAKGFADVYAQTIAYGMFAARLHDTSLDTFTRQEAADLIPKTNPFLRKLFQYVAGYDLDSRISWIVDGLADVFRATDVAELLKNFGSSTQTQDPIIHFYETFLTAYDPALRKARGVWYTPEPVVGFIVRAIDYILITEFCIAAGLADNSMTTIKVNVPGVKNQIEKQVHRVQFLDPATGTATFLAELIKQIHAKFKGQQGIWSDYVEKHLIPRLNGFEILMASYAMAHLKLDLLLRETGYVPKNEQRFRIYLTNSLEEHHADTGTLFANWLSTEANEANHVKRDTPVMVVTGNPPYSVSSTNKSEWIEKLTADYKKDLNERNIQPLSDDYIKFIRFGQHFIDKNGEGILAYISNNSFLDGIIHRQMRKHLLQSFDKIYILDLHGNAKKKEVCPDGSADQNVFDIMQGVSINVFVKTGKKKKGSLAEVFHFDLQGNRDFKYACLNDNNLNAINWFNLDVKQPEYFLIPKDNFVKTFYNQGFSVNDVFNKSSSGIQTEFDELATHSSKQKAESILLDLKNLDVTVFASKYGFQSKINKIIVAKNDVLSNDVSIQKIDYKIFNTQYCIYTGKTNGLMGRPRFEMMKNIISKKNYSICLLRSLVDTTIFSSIFISNKLVDKNFYGFQTSLFPLYLYPETKAQQTIEQTTERIPNLNAEIVKQIADKLGLRFVPEKRNLEYGEGKTTPAYGHPSKGGEFMHGKSLHSELASPPLEGCPTGGVVSYPLETCLSGEAVSYPLETCPQGGVALTVNPTHPAPDPPQILCSINNIPIKRNFVENLPCNHALSQRAKEKRKAGILSEVLFWLQVHKGAFHEIDFDRQRIIGNYIVDFYVKALGLVIEIDGSSHDTKVEYDRKRQQYLEDLGLKVYRLTDGDVKMNLGIVMAELERYIVEEYGELTTLAYGHHVDGGELATSVCDHPSKGGELATPVFDHPSKGGELAPIDILDYIYAVLHSPTYRDKYKEFLKIDFPRVPYPKDAATFWQLVALGSELRQIHLLESPVVSKLITQYPVGGSNIVGKIRYDVSESNVYINETQYFANVPKVAWEFYIGGYQPAQKWLKDRKERELLFDDILHYQKILVALTETDRIMKEIDKIELE